MHDLVKSHRNHPAIVVWGFCNEFECVQRSNHTGELFRVPGWARNGGTG